MHFGRWHDIADAAESAPSGPGVFQVRLRAGLIDYPRGKSAMILYGAAADLAAAARALAEAHPGRPWLVRFSEDLSPDEAGGCDAILDRLLASFERRFGTRPTLPR